MRMPDDATRFEPATLTVGALIVVALQTEVMLSRTAEGRWTITVRSTRSATPPSAWPSPSSPPPTFWQQNSHLPGSAGRPRAT